MDDEDYQNMTEDDLMYVKKMQEELIRLQTEETGNEQEIAAKIMQSMMPADGTFDEQSKIKLAMEAMEQDDMKARMMHEMTRGEMTDQNELFSEMLNEQRERIMNEQYQL